MRLNIKYALLQGAYCFAFASCNVYAVVVLRSFGVTCGQAGIRTACMNLAVMILMQRISVLADRIGTGTNRRIAAVAFTIAAVIAAAFIIIAPEGRFAGCLMYLLIVGSMGFVNPFLDAFSV